MTKKRDYAVILSVFSAAIAFTCAGIVTFNNFDQNGVVELGTFIGIGVALIGICATLIVGLQILNYLEFKEIKRKIQNIDEIESNIIKTKTEVDKTRTDCFSALLDLYCNTDIDADKEQDKGVSRLISSIVLLSKLQPNDCHRSEALYQLLHSQLYKIDTIENKPYHYDSFINISFDTTDKRSYKIVELHLRCIKRMDQIESWLPVEALISMEKIQADL
ncbi:hypothetical protein BN938_0681 [Mucinivorans hirudinis]|uniref:Uncharacterized protein n=1 Tax=Mucinivorans hirudinis TaxID=1433126 RepID=A0A060R6Q1_9BACT|nr:hypothetical protein BN938_0681 [Mucinivorans hirudinis]